MVPRRPEQPPSGGEVILAELRKWRVAVIAVAQSPSQVAQEAWRNAEYLVLHRCTLSPFEAQFLNLGFEEFEELPKLKTGEAFLIHRGEVKKLSVPKPRVRGRGRTFKPSIPMPKRLSPQSRAQLAELEGKVRALEEGLREARSLEKKVCGLQTSIERVEARLKELEAKPAPLDGLEESLQGQVRALERLVAQKMSDLASLRGEVGQLKEAFKAEVAELKEASKAVGALRQSLMKLEQQLDATPSVEQLGQLRREVSRLSGELKSVKAAMLTERRRLSEKVRRHLELEDLSDLVTVSERLDGVEVKLNTELTSEGRAKLAELLGQRFELEEASKGWLIHGVRDRRAPRPLKKGLRGCLGN